MPKIAFPSGRILVARRSVFQFSYNAVSAWLDTGAAHPHRHDHRGRTTFPAIPPGLSKNKGDNMNELSDSEAQSTNGGVFGLGFLEVIVAGIIIGASVNIIENWDSFKAGLTGTPDPAANE